MSDTSSVEVFGREFPAIRARLLDLAAALDRVDRSGPSEHESRWLQVRRALTVLGEAVGDRAEQVQQIFSLPYAEGWHDEYLGKRRT